MRELRPSIEECLQRDGAVVRDVMRGIDERYPPASGRGEEWLPRRGMPTQLGQVASPELRPPLGIVPEPAAQGRARCHVLCPVVEAEAGLGYAARPQPLDQHPAPIGL